MYGIPEYKAWRCWDSAQAVYAIRKDLYIGCRGLEKGRPVEKAPE